MNSKYEYYLINLDRATDRLEFMQNEFNKQGIQFTRIQAVDAKTLDPKSFKVKNLYDRDMFPGEFGCYLSHVKTLQTFLESNHDFAVIIEDDSIFEDHFKEIVHKTISKYQDLPKKHQWDVLKLRNGKRRNIKISDIDQNYFIGACGTSIPITTIAAIWTRNGAEKFLKKVVNPIPIIKRPIDCELQHPWEYNLLIYNLLPSIVKNAEIGTQIQADYSKKKASFWKQIRYEFNRSIPKCLYLIKQHGFSKFYQSFIAKKTERVL